MNMRALIGVLSVTLLSGCMTEQALRNPNVLSRDELLLTISEVKRQVLVYQNYVGYLRVHPTEDESVKAADAVGYTCGNSSIDFDITSVIFELSVTNTGTVSGGVGLAVPLGPATAPTGAATAGISASRATENSQVLTFPSYPIDPKPAAVKPTLDNAPIAAAIINLRDAMILSATLEGACMVDYNYRNPNADPEPTFKLGIKVTKTTTGTFAVSLAIVNITAGGSSGSVTGNTITVKFRQRTNTKSDPNNGIFVAPPVPNKPSKGCTTTPDCQGVFNVKPETI